MTKFQHILTSIALCSLSLGGVVGSSFAQYKVSNQPSPQTQTTAPDCRLPLEIAVTFLDSKCQEIKLQQDKTYYRYFSTDKNKFGRYLTTNLYEKNVDVIRNLALKQEWGNQATMMLTVTVPAGTTVYEGVVASQDPAQCYPGGGQQTFIQDSKDPNLKWSEGTPMKVKEFKCP